jgi:hypothetical protein
MSDATFPLLFASDEIRLLTGLVIGFMFGFVLERAGFGNARKLAGQFYLTDMTVFKVMFTAILVAMSGLYIMSHLGLVDMARIWVNPTFLWAQVAGGFLLGVGFILSGLCPGTAVVAAASGRWDGVVAVGGVFAGMAAFSVAIDVVPGIHRLYDAGAMGVSVLPAVLGIPTLWFVLLVVVVAGAAFIGAEKVESIFGPRRPVVELTPAPRPRAKFAVAGALGLALAGGLAFRAAPPAAPPAVVRHVEPAALADRILAGDANLVILDVRPDRDAPFPTAFPAALDNTALPVVTSAGMGVDIVLIDADGGLDAVPSEWPADAHYFMLRGGWDAWAAEVLAPEATEAGATMEEFARVQRQNQVAAFFSGAAAVAPPVAAPPSMPSAGAGGARPKRRGC